MFAQFFLKFAGRCTLWDPAVEMALNQGSNSTNKIPEIVGKVTVVATDKGIHGKTGVLSQHHISHEEIADRIDAEFFNQIERPHYVSQRLRHLEIFTQPPPVGEDCLWLRDISRKKHSRPVNGVRCQDIFAHQMIVDGPPLFKPFPVFQRSNGGHIVDEGVEPYVGHIVAVEGDLDSPRQAGLRP